jgi:alpha-N-arabinofuranosidase
MNYFFKILLFLIFWSAYAYPLFSQIPVFSNPIIKGGYSNPSISKVGDDFYIVNSSFEYFPALPIHHSKDLANWTLISHGINKKKQFSEKINLLNSNLNSGIQNPTIRYHNGGFYIVASSNTTSKTKLISQNINFVISAKSPKGPWSNPIIIEGLKADKIDLFIDNNKVFVSYSEDEKSSNISSLWLQELDSTTFQLIGGRNLLWTNYSLKNYVENSHIYKKDNGYQLLINFIDSSNYRTSKIYNCKNLNGPFKNNIEIYNSNNPSKKWMSDFRNTDMVEISNNRLVLVGDGIRNKGNNPSNMGKETFIASLENDTTQNSNNLSFEIQKKQSYFLPINDLEYKPPTLKYEFYNNKLDINWVHRKEKLANSYDLITENGFLKMNYLSEVINHNTGYNFIGLKQRENNFEVSTTMVFNPVQNGEEAGLCMIQKDDNYILFDVKREDNENVLQLVINPKNKNAILKKDLVMRKFKNHIELKISSDNGIQKYYYRFQSNELWKLFETSSSEIVLSEGNTASCFGLYATSNGTKSSNFAKFDLFKIIYLNNPILLKKHE